MAQRLVKPSKELLAVLEKWSGGKVHFNKNNKHHGRLDVILDRPSKGNCLSGEMMLDFGNGANNFDSEEHGVIVLRGEGQNFCTGADLGLISDLSSQNLGGDMFTYMSSALRSLNSSSAISVALIRGHALGGATEICAAADIRIAHAKSKIGFLQAKLGIVPSWGGADYLEKVLPRSKALKLMTSASVISAEEAHRLGWVDYVFHEDDEAEKYINSIIKNGVAVARAQKDMLNAVKQGFEQQKKVVEKVWHHDTHKNALAKQLAAVVKN